jgi:hypothetical protein
VNASSAQRQLQAQLTVGASAAKSVTLTVIGSAAHLPKAPEASATVTITAPPSTKAAAKKPTAKPSASASAHNSSAAAHNSSSAGQAPVGSPAVPTTVTAPLSIGNLPGIPAAAPTLSPGGNAASLFPTLDPKPATSPAQSAQEAQGAQKAQEAQKARTSPVADTSALPQGTTVVGAQLAGLAALALGFALAVTRLTIRRRRPSAAKRTTATKKPTQNNPATKPSTRNNDGKPPGAGPDNPTTDGLR